MNTLELVKHNIEKLNMKRQRVNGKMAYIIKNPETGKWAAITDEQADELNNLYHVARYGMTPDDDIFTLKA